MAKTVADLTTADLLKVTSAKFQLCRGYTYLRERDFFNPVHAEEANRRYGDPIPDRLFSAKQVTKILNLIKKHKASEALAGAYVGIEVYGRFYRAYFTKAVQKDLSPNWP